MPTNEEVRAAAERLRRHQMFVEGCEHLWNAHGQCQWCKSIRRDVDIGILANAYLAEHPEDDGEPADYEWLLETGWIVESCGIMLNCSAGNSLRITGPPGSARIDGVLVGSHQRRLPRELVPKTRGQVRRLIAALKGERP